LLMLRFAIKDRCTTSIN